ncbi:MAG: Flp family type IVb pilin [Bacteriovoracia bacterium]
MKKLLANEDGQGLTEYTILLILIAIVSIGMVKSIGTQVKVKLKEARNQINQISAHDD